MKQKLWMGNEAIALGAIRAGVDLVSGYPGTPSTEILETVAKYNPGDIYVEWSINEKSALEVAAGAAYTGARTMVTMKQVGLNVASDPLMSLAYVGIKGGMVIVVADDPGPISSQTEQDTRHFAEFSKLPVFDPSSPEEAYEMIQDAFSLSEQYETPVFLRPTTRVCHACTAIDAEISRKERRREGFRKDSSKWVIFPRLSYQNHIKIEARQPVLAKQFSEYKGNRLQGSGRKGIATGGISYAYVMENQHELTHMKLLKVGTPHPFPEELGLRFLEGLDEVLVIEELDPVIEKALLSLCGKHHLSVTVKGKLTGDVKPAGENSVESVAQDLAKFNGTFTSVSVPEPELPELPVRPPSLCAGCPHRASFYAIKTAMKGRKTFYCGDIGCYTLGNAMPLDMVDTCLCMGAGVTMAQGLHRMEPDGIGFAFIGDSTFFASGITGVINAIYNNTDIVVVVLDNSTTAMTGHQPHPGTGTTVMKEVTQKVSIRRLLEAAGVSKLVTADPLDLAGARDAVRAVADEKGVRAILFESPCIAMFKPELQYTVIPGTCIGCRKCIQELGCPAIDWEQGKAVIRGSLCYGCSICGQVCPTKAIVPQTAEPGASEKGNHCTGGDQHGQ